MHGLGTEAYGKNKLSPFDHKLPKTCLFAFNTDKTGTCYFSLSINLHIHVYLLIIIWGFLHSSVIVIHLLLI